MVFKEKKEFLELYNAMNETKYDNLYGARIIKIPEPQFVVFYNGKEKVPERQILRLSDMYECEPEHAVLELETLMLNINIGYNKQLMERCKTLRDYTVFVGFIRQYAKELSLKEAVEKAICECIAQDILAEFLKKNRAEVLKVSIYEYDEERHMQQERRDAHEEGMQEGAERKVISLICRKLQKGKAPLEIAETLEENAAYIESVCKIAEDYAPDYIEERVYEAVMLNR